MYKRILGILLSVCLLAGAVPLTKSDAESSVCTEYTGTNVEYQNYQNSLRWSQPVTSYLVKCSDDRFMRVQAGSELSGFVVEYYDNSYNLLNSTSVISELPLFGGFYETDSNYFILTGQNNSSESANVEVYRITKFDKAWNRIGSCGLYDCNTISPFDAGAARMDSSGKYLVIRTNHTMYKSSDGYNHQANVTIQVDMESMKITDSFTGVMNVSYGYVSHSFNQFVKIENNKLVTVDHGDAHPRSIVLLKYKTDISKGSFTPTYNNTCTAIDVMTFPGASGNNDTGAAVGGFEISDSAYLVAGNSVVQDSQNTSRQTRNVFVAAVSKDTSEVVLNWITSYDEGDGTTSNPQFVKINNNRYMLLWSRNSVVYYTEIDGSGNRSGEIYSLSGALSDCVPVVTGDKLVWYTWNDQIVEFYEISLSNLNDVSKRKADNGHDYQIDGDVTDGYVQIRCTKCGKTDKKLAATAMYLYWIIPAGTGSYYYSEKIDSDQIIGSSTDFTLNFNPSGADSTVVVEISDPDVISCTPYKYWQDTRYKVSMLKKGTSTITVYPKYNPELKKTYTFYVDDHTHDFVETGRIVDGYAISECSTCHKEKKTQVATGMSLWWRTTDSGYYWSTRPDSQDVGSSLYYYITVKPDTADTDIEIIVADPEIVSWSKTNSTTGKFTMLKSGTTDIIMRPRLNPSLSYTYTIKVNGDFDVTEFSADKESPQAENTAVTLKAVATGGSWSYQYKFYAEDENGNITVMKDYSTVSTCTWNPSEHGKYTLYVDVKDKDTVLTKSMEYTITGLKITSAALKLENDISVIFKAPAELDMIYYNPYIEIQQKKADGQTETARIDGIKSADGQIYEFIYTGINAKETADLMDVTIYAYDADGKPVKGSTKQGYSVKQYCMNQLSKTSDELNSLGITGEKQNQFKTLLVDLLNYSTEAQIYFNYGTANPANADLTDGQKAYATDDSVLQGLDNIADEKYVEIESPLAQWKSAGLNLLNSINLRVKFRYVGDISKVVLNAQIENGKSINVDSFDSIGNGMYYAYIDGIAAYQFSTPVYITLSADGHAISNTMRYSVESYADRVNSTSSYGRIVLAMIKYGKAAEAYKES